MGLQQGREGVDSQNRMVLVWTHASHMEGADWLDGKRHASHMRWYGRVKEVEFGSSR